MNSPDNACPRCDEPDVFVEGRERAAWHLPPQRRAGEPWCLASWRTREDAEKLAISERARRRCLMRSPIYSHFVEIIEGQRTVIAVCQSCGVRAEDHPVRPVIR